jgi:ribosome-associated protein
MAKPTKTKTKSKPKSKPKKHAAPKSARKSAKKPPRKPPARPAGEPVVDNPRALALARRVAALVADKKALDVVVLDVRGKTSYADYFVIASGESERQVAAMADHVTEEVKKSGQQAIGTEGQATGQWVLIDYGEVVAHLFFTEVRAFYDLEGLWADAPREKVGAKA